MFVLKNNHKDVVSVTILKQGKSDSIQLNAGEKKVVVKHPKNQSPFTVEAKDTKGEIMNINGKSSISLTPQDSLGNLKLLEIDRLIPGRSFKKCSVVHVRLFKLIYEVSLFEYCLMGNIS